jgi:prophage DNA circulation protein
MPARFDPLSALEGSFLGFPFKIARERGEGGRRGPVHEYPDRDEPYFEDLGRRARRWELNVYFVGPSADLQADLWDKLLWKGQVGALMLPRLRRERVKAQTWSYDRDAGKGNWVSCQVAFIEAGQNQFPAPTTSWPHALLEAALDARTAFANALGDALSLVGLDGTLSQEALEGLIGDATVLGDVLTVVAQVAGGQAPASALADAGLLVAGYTGALGIGKALDVAVLATSTISLLAGWADALAGPSPDRGARMRAIDGLFSVYDEAASDAWYVPEALTPLQSAVVANQAAFSQGIRRGALAEIARQAASLAFATYDDAVVVRARLADAFDDEIHFSTAPDGARAALLTLRSATLQAFSAAGADKARLVTYAVPRSRPALALAQLFYGDDADVPGRAAELVARTGAIHPAFLPARGERLSK